MEMEVNDLGRLQIKNFFTVQKNCLIDLKLKIDENLFNASSK